MALKSLGLEQKEHFLISLQTIYTLSHYFPHNVESISALADL